MLGKEKTICKWGQWSAKSRAQHLTVPFTALPASADLREYLLNSRDFTGPRSGGGRGQLRREGRRWQMRTELSGEP